MKIANKVNSFLLNPFVIGLFITMGVIFILPNAFPKYEISLVNQEVILGLKRVYFNDIDGDNKSEKFVLLNSKKGKASYIMYDSNDALIDQFNLSTEYSWYRNVWFQDANNNGVNEFYLLTKSKDSIFLNIHEHFTNKKVIKKKIFVDKIGNNKGEFTFSSRRVNGYFSTLNETNEIIFDINVGYGKTPRNVYKYNYTTNKIKKSPHLTNTFFIAEVLDLNNDNKNEILINTVATSNDLDSLFSKRSDYNTWIIALNDDLDYLFKPIEIKSKGRLKGFSLKNNSESSLIYLFQSRDKKVASKLIKIDLKGNILEEVIFSNDDSNFIKKIDEETFVVYNPINGVLNYYNINLELLKSNKLDKSLLFLGHYDMDNDGEREWLALNRIREEIQIYRNDLKSFAELKKTHKKAKDLGIKELNTNEKHLFFNFKNKLFFYNYVKNKHYILKYFIYVCIYALVLIVVFLIIKSHQFREKKKSDIEKKILDLQLKNIKNQVDSHFVFNALNTISEMSLSSNKIELDSFISGYSKFMRTTLEHSDKIATTIKEELDYVENFIKLQQLKFKGRFDYDINVHQNVSTYIKIPKHSIFTYVENSLKYGLPKQGKGLISISLKQQNHCLIIEIIDNGTGLKKPVNFDNKGTGKGLKIMTTIFNLYQNRFKTEIEHSVNNIKDENKIVGVIAKIKIKLNSSKNFK